MSVHMGWRRARSLRSDDADTERRMIAIKKARVDGQAEEARQLGLELDSDDDPAGVVRKLHRSPAGCLLLLNEFTGLHNRIDKYEILFWSQRERLFHCLGKRLRDLFTDDQMITDWVVALMGAVYGDAPPEEKTQAIGEVFEGMLPPWMDVIEYQVRIDHLVAAVAGRKESIERVKSLPRRGDPRRDGSSQAGQGPRPARAQARAPECLGGRHTVRGPAVELPAGSRSGVRKLIETTEDAARGASGRGRIAGGRPGRRDRAG